MLPTTFVRRAAFNSYDRKRRQKWPRITENRSKWRRANHCFSFANKSGFIYFKYFCRDTHRKFLYSRLCISLKVVFIVFTYES